MGTHWSLAHNPWSEERVLGLSIDLVAKALIGKCFDQIRHGVCTEGNDANAEPSIDIHAALVASKIGEGFFHDSSLHVTQLPWKAAHALLNAVHEVLNQYTAVQNEAVSMKLIPNIHEAGPNDTPGALHICLRAKNTSRVRSYFDRMLRPIDTHTLTLRQNALDHLLHGTNNQGSLSKPELQRSIHRTLRYICDQQHVYPSTYEDLKSLARQWIQSGFWTEDSDYTRFRKLPSQVIMRFFCLSISRVRMEIPADYFKKKINCRILQRANSFRLLCAHRMPASLSEEARVLSASQETTKPSSTNPRSECQNILDASLPRLPKLSPEPKTSDSAILLVPESPADGSRSGPASSSNLIEKLFGKLPRGEARDCSSALCKTSNQVSPMCIESPLPLPPPLLLGDDKAFQLPLPQIIPDVGSMQGPGVHPSGGEDVGLSNIMFPVAPPTQEGEGKSKKARPHSIVKQDVGQRRRRRKALEMINPRDHKIPTSATKHLQIWHTNPITGDVVPNKWFCHVNSCYEGRVKPKSYSTFAILQQHYRYHTTLPQRCPICDEKFSSRGSRDTHIRKQHPGTVDPGAAPPVAKRRKTTNRAQKIDFEKLFAL